MLAHLSFPQNLPRLQPHIWKVYWFTQELQQWEFPYCHVYECDYRIGLDWKSDLLDAYRKNYKWLRQSHWVTDSTDHCNHNTLKVFSVFLSRRSVAAFDGGCSPSSGFLNCPRRQLPAYNGNSSQRLDRSPLTNSLSHLTELTDCPALNISPRTA
jgi:hypothetical protein